MRGQSLKASILSLVLFVGIVILGILWFPRGFGLLTMARVPDAAELEELKSEGGAMVALIEQWHAEHGRYPVSLEAAAINVPIADYGGWTYLTDREGTDFSLSIGPYSPLYPFSLTWLTESQTWYFHD